MSRAILIVLDSVGIGGAPDAAAYGDDGANTLAHIAEACAIGAGDRAGLRQGPLKLPNLAALGLGQALAGAGHPVPALNDPAPTGLYGHAAELSKGKDTPSGHWEIAGVPVRFDWGYFPKTVPAFPAELTEALIVEADLPGILGDCHGSGTDMLAKFGEAHIRTGQPILYTSADSVLQIAAHEESFGLERLYALCGLARGLVDDYRIGRVIARPFLGSSAADFHRTPNRRDYATPPPEPTLLDRAVAAGRRTIAVGKIGDIFAHRGISENRKAPDNDAMFDRLLEAVQRAGDGDMIFVNFVDFDMLYGHRRDVAGYAAALEAFDRRLPQLIAALLPGDLALITADHGCDPTFRGSDHTREQVPVLGFGPGIAPRDLGALPSFADIGESVAHHLGLAPGAHGRSFL